MKQPCDRNLLFGILAHQIDFVSLQALVEAVRAWTQEKAKPLGQVLVERGWLLQSQRELLEPLVDAHVEQHSGDVAKSLRVLSSVGGVSAALTKVDDSEVRDSLAVLGDPIGPTPMELGNRSTASIDGHDIDQSDSPVEDKAYDHFATEVEGDGDEPGATTFPSSSGPRFRILRPHAEGGLGKVSVALDSELHREVAFKEIQERYADEPSTRSRFLVEAEVTGALEHPGIVPVYGLGHFPDGRPFYAMRFVRGQSLLEAVRSFHAANDKSADSYQGNRSFRDLLNRLIDVCNAIQYAHDRRVLHRDLKPGNIMLGNYGETLVVDWGLAKADSHASSEGRTSIDFVPIVPASGSNAALTRMGSALGTPQYMPPEQASGQLELLGPASDIYSLGATLYEVLSGKPPLADADSEEVLQRVESGDIPSPREENPSIPKPLDAICRQAMAVRPENRYESARSMASDLEAWLADEPVGALDESIYVRLRRWMRRHQAAVNATAASVGLAIVGLVVLAVVVSDKNSQLAKSNGLLEETNIKLGDSINDLELANTKERAARDLAIANETRAKKGERLARQQTMRLREESAKRNVVRAWRELEQNNPLLSMLYLGSAMEIASVEDSGELTAEQKYDRELREKQFYGLHSQYPLSGCWPNTRFATYSEDASKIATLETNGHISIWDAATNRLLCDVRAHQGAGICAVFDASGTRIACGSHLGELRVVDIAQQRIIFQADLAAGIKHVWFLEQDKVAVSTVDNTLAVYDPTTQERVLQSDWGEEVSLIAFSDSGKSCLARIADSGSLRVVDSATAKFVGSSIDVGGEVIHAEFNSDGSSFLTLVQDIQSREQADGERQVRVYSVANHKQQAEFRVASKTTTATFVGLEKVAVAATGLSDREDDASDDPQLGTGITVYAIDSGTRDATSFNVDFSVQTLTASGNGRYLSVHGQEAELGDAPLASFQVLDLQAKRMLTAVVPCHSGEIGIEFAVDSETMLVSGQGFGAPLSTRWDLALAADRCRIMTIENEPIEDAMFYPGRPQEIVAWTARTMATWDEQGALRPAAGEASSFVAQTVTDEVRLERRERSMLTNGFQRDGTIQQRDIYLGYTVAIPWLRGIQVPKPLVAALSENPIPQFRPPGSLPSLVSSKRYIAFSQGGDLAVIQDSVSNGVRVVRLEAQAVAPLTPLLAHDSKISMAWLSNDNRLLATASPLPGDSSSSNVRVWDCVNGQPLTPNLIHDGSVIKVQFDEIGSGILVAAGNTVRLWRLSPQQQSSPGFSAFALARCVSGNDLGATGEPTEISWEDIARELVASASNSISSVAGSSNLNSHRAVANYAVRNNLTDLSITHLKAWAESDPSNLRPKQLLADCYGQQGRYLDALECFYSSVDAGSGVLSSAYRRALLSKQLSQDAHESICNEMLRDLEATDDPDDRDQIVWAQGMLQNSNADFSAVMQAARLQVEKYPTSRRYHNTLGVIAFRAGMMDVARDTLSKASLLSESRGHEVVAELLRRYMASTEPVAGGVPRGEAASLELQSVLDSYDLSGAIPMTRADRELTAAMNQRELYEPDWAELLEYSLVRQNFLAVREARE